MKQLKPFLPSLYSEFLLNGAGYSNTPGKGPAEGDLIGSGADEKSAGGGGGADGEGDLRGPGGEGKGTYERGLGETFGFPGDARKMRERSKMKLWKEYFSGECPFLPAARCGAVAAVFESGVERVQRMATRPVDMACLKMRHPRVNVILIKQSMAAI